MRRTLAPLLVVATIRCATFAIAFPIRATSPGSPLLDVLFWVLALALPLMAVAFLAGELHSRLFVASALERLGTMIGPTPSSGTLRSALAETLDDESLEVASWAPRDGRLGRRGWIAGCAPRAGFGPERDRGPIWPPPRRNSHPRRGAGRGSRLRGGGGGLRTGGVREPASHRQGPGLNTRGSRVTLAHPRVREPGAPAHRARPPRRRPAAARGAADPPGADGGDPGQRSGAGAGEAARARRRGGGHARLDPLPGPRRLPGAAGGPGARGGAAVG